MRDLKLKISISLSELGEKFSSDQCLSFSCSERIIDKELRKILNDERLSAVVREEIYRGFQFSEKDLFSKIRFPLTMDLKETGERIRDDLRRLIPNVSFTGYFSDYTYRISHISLLPFNGGTIDILHPKSNEHLTTKYIDGRSKLGDGTWTYIYQCHESYAEIIEIVPAPFDESVVSNYFKSIGISYEILTTRIIPLPEISQE
jgi:hypothetical protein